MKQKNRSLTYLGTIANGTDMLQFTGSTGGGHSRRGLNNVISAMHSTGGGQASRSTSGGASGT